MMATEIVRLGLVLAAAYLAAGIVGAALLHRWGLVRIDPATASAGIGFRLLITPGLVALWPWMLARWVQARRGTLPTEPPTLATPRTLRRLHGLAWRALVVVAPLIVGAALAWRPRVVPDNPLPAPSAVSAPSAH